MFFDSLHLSRYLVTGLLLISAPGRAETYDNWCLAHFDAAQIAAGLASPLRDIDFDKTANVIEYLGDTDPWDSNSRLLLERGAARGTISFTMALDREDVVYEVTVSDDLLGWSEDAVHLCAGSQVTWHLNGRKFVKLGVKRRIGFTIDSDRDGLDDYFEESLVASNPADGITHIGEVLPADDFDNNGTENIAEAANAPQPMPGGSHAPPAVIDAAALNGALASLPPSAPAALEVHTPLH